MSDNVTNFFANFDFGDEDVTAPVIRRRPTKKTYAVAAGPNIKIGRAKDISARMRTLQTAHADRLVLVAQHESDVERSVHRRLARLGIKRMNGEWFQDSLLLRQALAELGFRGVYR